MIFYLLALLPILVWAIQWYCNRKVVWQEAAAGAGAALIVAGIFHAIQASDVFVPFDTETYSSRVTYARYQPRWKEYYEVAVYRTEIYQCGTLKQPRTCSRQVFDHWRATSCWHNETWEVVSPIYNTSINRGRYNDILEKFGGTITQLPGIRTTGSHNSRMLEGDPLDQYTKNTTEYVYPITKNFKFENRLLGASTLYNLPPVPEARVKELFEWPDNPNEFESDRLMGHAKSVWDRREWDQMNAVLGPTKNVNVIAVGFANNAGEEMGRLQERYWQGGKKNDLVLVFGGEPRWAYVFGWTEHETVKRLLENRLRDNKATIAEITDLIQKEYQLLNFEDKFAYIDVEPPWWYYLIFFIVVAVTQSVTHYICTQNEYEKCGTKN